MLFIEPDKYETFLIDDQTTEVYLHDHLCGFDLNLRAPVLDRLSKLVPDRPLTVASEYIVNQQIKNNYPNFNFVFSVNNHNRVLDKFRAYNIHPELKFKNFLCSFNGSPHVSRKLLVAILHKFGWFNTEYSSKNFVLSQTQLSGHIQDYVKNNSSFYDKFFLSDNDEFYSTIYSFGNYGKSRYNHYRNIVTLEKQLTDSFVNLVSDTMATSYYPFYGEKFLYSVVTRGLFVSYGQPNWHSTLENCYGFKKYNRIFDYSFDEIANPVERLLELVSMLGKFSMLTQSDWRDLYSLEIDNIEYNYDHYYSRDYIKCLKKFE